MAKPSLPDHVSLRLEAEQSKRVHSYLLHWYAAEHRDLPWRTTHDSYAILVSEMMLQQTQVQRVLPKFEQFLATFPTLADLAAASTADVISVWIPLGYNMRAVRLQSIARQVMNEFDGKLPDTIEELLKLKGIGRYTAGAIACFAFLQQVAMVDTNIHRVLHRVFFGMDLSEPRLTNDQRLTFAEQVLPDGKAYDWNQALMDLGATICTSANPQCYHCPVQDVCKTYTEMSHDSLFPSGTMMRQLRKVAEKKVAYQKQPFTSTNRYFRGRIVDHLCSQPEGQRIPLTILGPIIKQDFQKEDLIWLQQLVEKLAKDGLVDFAEEGVRLP
jgi:A/G-specific adenine glycosylase